MFIRSCARRTSRRRFAAASFLIPLCVACASPATRSVSDAELARALADRADSVDAVAQALALADLGALSVPRPAAPTELSPDFGEFWQACAFAWNPELRRARREVRVQRALSRSAGSAGAFDGELEAMDLGDPQADMSIKATVDLLAVLGLGPAAAARELARRETRAAFARFESTVWSVRFEVERARIAVAAAVARESAMNALYTEASEELPRIEILAARGWIGAAMHDGALASLHMVEHERSSAHTELGRARAELARACGLDADHAALERVQSGAIERLRDDDVVWFEPSAEQLLQALPSLRAAKLELATAEAAVRVVARERWPQLRVGPRLAIASNDTTLGGLVGIEFPFPGTLDGELEAAVERRDGQLEALEDELIAARSRLAATRTALEATLEQMLEHAPAVDTSMARMFIAAQARFRLDPEALGAWSTLLRDRIASLQALIEARTNASLAHLDYEEARGARAQVQP